MTPAHSVKSSEIVRLSRRFSCIALLAFYAANPALSISVNGAQGSGHAKTKESYTHQQEPPARKETGNASRPGAGELSPSFAAFDRRARAGSHLNVVFFGASLTWGANASDPQQTSYRADVARRFEERYPSAHFRFFDAAIGGTGSQLGAFRLERDVLRHHPDLVFLDFTANDTITSADPETLASYESVMRRIIMQGHAPVVQMILPFEWDVQHGRLNEFKRRTAHLQLSQAYGTAVGDAVTLALDRVRTGASPVEKLWPIDGAHPGDAGYDLFADAAWQGYCDGVSRNLVCHVPADMVNASTYMTPLRSPLSSLPVLPSGWSTGQANRTSAYYDMLMSRWLDSEVVATDDGRQPQPLKLRFRGSMAMLFGEGTMRTGRYRITIDGKQQDYDTGSLARNSKGNTHLVQLIAQGLDSSVDHTLEIEPMLEKGQELRLESLCVAGGLPQVALAQ